MSALCTAIPTTGAGKTMTTACITAPATQSAHGERRPTSTNTSCNSAGPGAVGTVCESIPRACFRTMAVYDLPNSNAGRACHVASTPTELKHQRQWLRSAMVTCSWRSSASPSCASPSCADGDPPARDRAVRWRCYRTSRTKRCQRMPWEQGSLLSNLRHTS